MDSYVEKGLTRKNHNLSSGKRNEDVKNALCVQKCPKGKFGSFVPDPLVRPELRTISSVSLFDLEGGLHKQTVMLQPRSDRQRFKKGPGTDISPGAVPCEPTCRSRPRGGWERESPPGPALESPVSPSPPEVITPEVTVS